MISLPSGTRIWLIAGVTDMRKSFNGLGEQIQHVLDEKPFSGHLFIFRGRRGDMIKILWADADGLCLFTRRLEEGQFIWPAVRDGKISITRSQLAILVEETEAFLRSALARAEEKIEEDEREIEHLRAQIEKLRRMLFGTRSEKLQREVEPRQPGGCKSWCGRI
ncbi:IS66 family insertion sequence element accessory protein TnpB [Salmonella enterica subsp. enterica serovar Infantis]|nr:IS66 family insertion sequence element accessory protein TnpB [Salmonella enterica subsp. enterica serovar Infantis]